MRYAPFAVIALVLGGLVIALAGRNGDDRPRPELDPDLVGEQVMNEQELVASGPMTPARAELEGLTDIDFGPNCDSETGRIKLISVHAPPCVEPFTGDNEGATASGVTGDTVKIVHYRADPSLDPLTAAMLASAGADIGADDDAATADETIKGYVDLYNKLFETYGRTVEFEVFIGTGSGDDAVAARNDAIEIAAREPFAVVGGPYQSSPVFADELASRGIICGPGCVLAVPESVVEENVPYLWSAGPTPDQSAALTAELVAKLAGPGKATMAGDATLRDQDRRYALVRYDNPDGDHTPVARSLTEALSTNGIEISTEVEFDLDLARAQENARNHIAKLKDTGITTVIYYGDPLTPAALTAEATAQDYFPEWILGPSLYMDTTLFARLADQAQWGNGFGLALTGTRGDRSDITAFRIFEWAYGREAPNNTAAVIESMIRTVFNGVHLAGPTLTPESFRDGLFRFPVSGGGPTEVQVSRGDHGVWPDFDWGGSDDAAVIWWDPDATGEDEVGNPGQGMYRYARGGARYTIGNFPSSARAAGLFDDESSVTVFDQIPPEDLTPSYPPPA